MSYIHLVKVTMVYLLINPKTLYILGWREY
jgi:hypothetical protein